MRRFAGSIAVLLAGSALADGPSQSLRPIARDVAQTIPAVQEDRISTSSVASLRPLRPQLRNDAVLAERAFQSSVIVYRATKHAPLLTERPVNRPAAILAMGQRRSDERARGAVCGDLNIHGEAIADIPRRIAGCGVVNPVRVRSVAGVLLSTPARMDCTTARALRTWVENGVKPAVGTQGGGIRSLRVAAGFACRMRNNQPGAKVSEHGSGRAIDIAGIWLNDGSEMSVLTDWNSGAKGRALRQMHRAACGPFGTVLGPEADRFHRDHFHFDTARYRSGSYCR